ncbi:uncharacterized protein E5676_scaffold22G00160 [Cucumis melo var. makuwa]|uniref:Envelope-like protein n=1 Tax=Cucumis melo var. makuwa TaxID=1194695 RepID=A0A5A7ULP0_CUCMM|nr:uncharacterized protein E6C27_scaffold24G003800 [Cucumis melo var. makuwa]TYK27549.1 uncharacterized protein E5676_scaffold22G00160 [Cucumis melo var. makuwa]
MVNTRKGTYTDKSFEEVLEAPSLRAAVHGIQVRGRRFKSTLPRRPYRIPSEKSHAYIPRGLTKSLHKEIDSGNVTKDAETVPTVSEAHFSDMNSDDLDDVPLARLLKKVAALDVVPEKSTDPVLFCSLSREFVSPIPDNTASTDPHAALVDASVVPD